MKMKFWIVILMMGHISTAQVGIGTSSPNEATMLDINSLINTGQRGGFGLPSVASDTERDEIDITNARSGILIYHAGDREVQIYDAENGLWQTFYALPAITNTAPTATIQALARVSDNVNRNFEVFYTYSDNENDAEGATMFQWYRADDASGTNRVAIPNATNGIYRTTIDDANKFIAVEVTPVAVTGVSPGNTIISDYEGPIIDQENEVNFIQQNQTVQETSDPTADNVDLQFAFSNSGQDGQQYTISASDYGRFVESGPQTVNVPANTGSPYTAVGVFNVLNDNQFEPDEQVTLTITSVNGGGGRRHVIGATNTDTVTITDDDAAPANLLTEDFETDGNGTRYNLSVVDNAASNADYFRRTDGSDIRADHGNTTGFFYAGEDIDGVNQSGSTGGSTPAFVTYIDPITVVSGTSYTLSLDISEDDDGTAQDWDATDSFMVEISEDGGNTWTAIFAIESTGGTNTEPSQDDDLDGVGDGVNVVTDSFSSFNAAFTPTANSILVRLSYDLDSGDEDIAIDNITIN